MLFLTSFFRRITDDLKLKKLIPLKILFFVHASTLFVLYPYLTIHMRELGISVEEAAIMSAVTPVVSIVMPPLAGMLADKIGNFRLLLALSSVLGGASALLLLLVPVGRLTLTFPREAELLLSCSGAKLQLLSVQEYPCSPLHAFASDLNISVQSCGFVCDLPAGLSDQEEAAMLRNTYYAVTLRSPAANETAVYRYAISASGDGDVGGRKHQSTTRILTNNDNYDTSVRRVSHTELFFPTSELYRMDCVVHETMNASCSFQKRGSVADVEPPPTETATYRARVTHDVRTQRKDVRRYGVEAIHRLDNDTTSTSDAPDYDGVDSVTCRDQFSQEQSSSSTGSEVVSVWTGGRRLPRCRAGCVSTAPRASLCDNKSQQIEIDPVFTFWSYLAVRVFIGIISGTAFAMFEGAVIAILRDQQADYGLQRIYGSIGGMISSPLSGFLIDYASRGKGYTDFRPAFYLYAVLKIMSGALMLSIDLQFKQPAQNLMEDVLTVFCNIEIVALFIACFIMGTAWGYIESFLFWLLQDLGASQSLMGITITVGGVAGLPLLVMSGPIIRRLGHANVLFIGFIFYAIRLLGYSAIYNPWLCLVFEALESVTSSLSFTAAVTYAARLSSSTTDTSVQGLLGGIYYGVGKGSGSLIGGYLMKFFGTRTTYQIFSAFTLLTGCIYFLFNKFYLRKRPQREANDIYKKKPKLDVEGQVMKVKENANKDGATVAKEKISDSETNPGVVAANMRRTGDNTDGSSDSGVDNVAYATDGEATSTGSDTKDKHDNK